MSRKKAGKNIINGWLALDKPVGPGSTKVLGRVRWLFNAAKAGHGGTLDPLASGILPIAFGEATKTVAYMMDAKKTYEFTVCIGKATTTDDGEGEVIETSDIRPAKEDIVAAMQSFTGQIQQTPPAYSAIKINGERAYTRARRGEDVKIKSRTVTVDSFVLTKMDDQNTASFKVECGKGTYVRSLGRDLFKKLGSCAYITHLRRTRVGKFSLKDAISLEKIEELGHSASESLVLFPVQTVLDDIPALAVSEKHARCLSNGQKISLAVLQTQNNTFKPNSGELVQVLHNNRLIALARITEQMLKPERVFNLGGTTAA